jgi:hypothetical protein
MTTRETTKTTTSQRLTSRQQQRKKSHDDNTINTRQSRQRHYDLSSASSIGSIENGPDDSTDDGVHRQKKFKGNTHEELLTDESRQDTSTSLHQGKPRTGRQEKWIDHQDNAMSKPNSDCSKMPKQKTKMKPHASQQIRKQHHHYHGTSNNIWDDIQKSRTVNDTNDNNTEISVSSSSLAYSSTESPTPTATLKPTSIIRTSSIMAKRKSNQQQLSYKWEKFFHQTRALKPTVSQTCGTKWHQSRIQLSTSFQSDNLHFGDDLQNHSNIECFIFHNINGIKDETNWVQINQKMHELDVTGFGLAEINTTFRGQFYQKWHDFTRKAFRHSKMISSESDVIYENAYQPGGTLTAIVGKWQARISAKGSDTSGLGRWSYCIISSNKKNLVIVTTYKPIKTQGKYSMVTAMDTATGTATGPGSNQMFLQ